jgi:CrcB protein
MLVRRGARRTAAASTPATAVATCPVGGPGGPRGGRRHGTAARYALSGRFERGAGAFPLATFGENVVGAVLLGLLVAVLVSGRSTPGWARPLLATGALGAFTTSSAFATELTLLGRDGRTGLAVAYGAAR